MPCTSVVLPAPSGGQDHQVPGAQQPGQPPAEVTHVGIGGDPEGGGHAGGSVRIIVTTRFSGPERRYRWPGHKIWCPVLAPFLSGGLAVIPRAEQHDLLAGRYRLVAEVHTNWSMQTVPAIGQRRPRAPTSGRPAAPRRHSVRVAERHSPSVVSRAVTYRWP